MVVVPEGASMSRTIFGPRWRAIIRDMKEWPASDNFDL